MIATPDALRIRPRPDSWLVFSEPRIAIVKTGKVELGQGLLGAVRQIAADALCVPPNCVHVVSGDTRQVPDEWYTAGSLSVETAWAVLRTVCLHVRCCLLDAAAQRLGVESSTLTLEEGGFIAGGRPTGLDAWAVARAIEWDVPVKVWRKPGEPSVHRWVGHPIPRPDLAAKIAGAGFIHDIDLPGMVHARVVEPPFRGARLLAWAKDEVQRRYPGISILPIGPLVAVTAAREETAVAASAAEDLFQWSVAAARIGDAGELLVPLALPGMQAVPRTVVEPYGVELPLSLQACYERPFIAHASIGPCCALARFAQGKLSVWTHSQGVFALQAQIARALRGHAGLVGVEVIHAPGAGCYGHNGADDAAFEACLIALQVPDSVVRLLWSRSREFRDAPAGSAMVVKLGASLCEGRIASWHAELWSGSHGQRPGWDGRMNLPAARAIMPCIDEGPAGHDLSIAAGGGGDRNAAPLYGVGSSSITYHYIRDMPVRTSSLRTLGAHANVFAIESFMDELAALDGSDPLEFRRRHLDDPRALGVLERVARMSAWQPNQAMETGRGKGVGLARYKNKAAWMAAVVEVELEEDIRVTRVWCAVDCGLAVDPDGVRNQVEGGVVQALSWSLCENLPATRDGEILARTWEDYSILGFTRIPRIEVELLDSGSSHPLGVGEVAAGPVAGALANAVAVAAGARVRRLPIDKDALASALA